MALLHGMPPSKKLMRGKNLSTRNHAGQASNKFPARHDTWQAFVKPMDIWQLDIAFSPAYNGIR